MLLTLFTLFLSSESFATSPGDKLPAPIVTELSTKLYIGRFEFNKINDELALKLLWIPNDILAKCIGSSEENCVRLDYCSQNPRMAKDCPNSSKENRMSLPSRLQSSYISSKNFPLIKKLYKKIKKNKKINKSFSESILISNDLSVHADIKHEAWLNGSNFKVITLRESEPTAWEKIKTFLRKMF